VIQAAGQFVPLKLNAEQEGRSLAQQYGVSGFPTFLFLDGAGKVQDKIVGYLYPADFAARLASIAKAHKIAPTPQARGRSLPSEAQSAGELAANLIRQGDIPHAEALVASAERKDPLNKGGYLTTAYNGLGAYYQNKGQLDKAVPFFQKAARTGKQPYDVAYAHIGIALCCLQQKKPALAVPELRAVLVLPNCPPGMKQLAAKTLEAAQKSAP